jgi:hypothetical protein
MTGLIEKIKDILFIYEETRKRFEANGYLYPSLVYYSETEQALCAIKQEIEKLCPNGDYFFHCKKSKEQFDEPCILADIQDSEICCEQGIEEDDILNRDD